MVFSAEEIYLPQQRPKKIFRNNRIREYQEGSKIPVQQIHAKIVTLDNYRKAA